MNDINELNSFKNYEINKKNHHSNIYKNDIHKTPNLPCILQSEFQTLKEQEKMLKSYNKEFYSTLNTLKNNSKFPTIYNNIQDKEMLGKQTYLYEYQNNSNACITSTVGQVWNTIEDAYSLNSEVKKEILEIKDDLFEINSDIDNINNFKEMKEFIVGIRSQVQNFLVNQKTHTYKLVKEIAILTKDKMDLQNSIKFALEKIKRLEKEIGIKQTLHNNAIDRQIEEYVCKDNRFFIKEHVSLDTN